MATAPQASARDAAPFGIMYAWSVVGLLTLISASSFIDRTVLGMLVKPIRSDLHISDTQFSLLAGAAFALMYTGFGIPFGWASDRFSRRAIVSMGCAAWSVMTGLCGVAGTYVALFLTRVGVGVGEASLNPCAYPLIGLYFPAGQTARAMSIYNMGQPIGGGLAMIIGGAVIGTLNTVGTLNLPLIGPTRPWQLVFLIVAAPGLLLALAAALIVQDVPRKARSAGQPSVAAVAQFMWRERKVYAPLTVGLSCVAIVAYGGSAWFPAFLMRVYDFSPAKAGLFIGLSGSIGGVIGNYVAGAATDHLIAKGRRDIATLVLVPIAIGAFLCVAVAPIVPIPKLSLALFAGFGLFMLTATGVYHALRQAVTPSHIWGQVTAIYNLFTNLIGLLIGPTAIAICTDYIFHNDRAVNFSIALVAGLSMTILVVVLLLYRKGIIHRMDEPAQI